MCVCMCPHLWPKMEFFISILGIVNFFLNGKGFPDDVISNRKISLEHVKRRFFFSFSYYLWDTSLVLYGLNPLCVMQAHHPMGTAVLLPLRELVHAELAWVFLQQA